MSTTTRTIAFGLLNLAIVAVYALGSRAWVDSGDAWYRQLEEPAWQPPDPVFGIAWSYNFLMLAVVGFFIAAHASGQQRATWFIVFTISVAAALAWAYLFYVRHELWGAAIALACAAALTVVLTGTAWKVRWWLGVLMLPYVIWVCLATSLSARYATLN
jgi:benzodiazapine receptor